MGEAINRYFRQRFWPYAAYLITTCFSLAGTVGAATAAELFSGQTGIASTYSADGKKTASGEISNSKNMTAAHRTLPFGTMVRVTNRRTSQAVIVRINDRGPFIGGRIIDLTSAAAQALGFTGLAQVDLSVVAGATQ